MSDRCPAIEELESVLALPAADPRRRHVDDCARCRSLADMLREFAVTSVAPAAAGFGAADPSLRDTIAELTGVRDEVAPAVALAPSPGAPRELVPERTAPRAPWWSFGALRPAFAFAALLVVAFAGVAVWRANTREPLMRDASGAGAGAFAARPAHPVAGGLELTWTAEPGVDEYRVVFLDGALREIAHSAIVTETRVMLESSALPDGLEHGAQVAWYVEARAGGDFVSKTAARTLKVP